MLDSGSSQEWLYLRLIMKIEIVCISDSDKHFATAVAEYMKRLGKSVEIHDLKPYRHDNPAFIIVKETAQIKEILQKKFAQYYKILLSKSGKDLRTEDLWLICSKNANIVFIIWGPYGLDEEELKPMIDMSLSFGKITMPHGLAKLVLLEQIYRIQTIENWKSYHY